MAKLVVRTDGLPAEVIQLKRGINRFGRSSGNDFQIEHPSVSRFHCEIEVRDEAMFVRDLDSSNGTYINDQQVGEAQLETGHILRLGEVNMEVKDAPRATLVDEFVPCTNHPKHPALMECTQCHKKFCGSCVHILKRLNGQYLKLCPICSGQCQSLEVMRQEKKKFLGDFVSKFFKKRTQQTPYQE